MNKRCKEYIKHNVLILPFEDVLRTAQNIDPTANKNVISQAVVNFVKRGELEVCFYNPKKGMYDLLPAHMVSQLRMAKLAEGTFPSKLYRSLRKKATYEINSNIVDVNTKVMTETPQEYAKELKQSLPWYERKGFLISFFSVVLVLLVLTVLFVSGAL